MSVSYNSIILACCLVFGLNSCKEKEQSLSPTEINYKVDSILNIKVKTIQKDASEDLKHRIIIELKPKVDSILNKTSTPDSTLPSLDTSGLW